MFIIDSTTSILFAAEFLKAVTPTSSDSLLAVYGIKSFDSQIVALSGNGLSVLMIVMCGHCLSRCFVLCFCDCFQIVAFLGHRP